MMGTGVHVIDLIRFITGDELVQVSALTDGGTDEEPLENVLTVIIKLASGAFAVATSGRISPYSSNDIVVYGSEMKLNARGTLAQEYGGEIELIGRIDRSVQRFQGGDLYRSQIESFQRSIKEDTEPNASGEDGLITVKVVDAVYESSRTGKAVILSGSP